MPSPLAKAKAAVNKSLKPHETDRLITDFILSIAASIHMPGDAESLWGWLIGPPGSMKTEILRGFECEKSALALYLSTLTPNSLISGYERQDGTDPSLLPLFNNKLVIIKEFTSVMGLPEAAVKQIFSDLRGIYDGFHSKGLGTVGIRQHRSKFSMLAAVTPAIDSYMLTHTELGERFLAFRIGSSYSQGWKSRMSVAKHVWDSAKTKTIWRKQINLALVEALSSAKTRASDPTFNDAASHTIMHLANIFSLTRSIPLAGGTAEAELPTRTLLQLRALAGAHAIVDGRTEVNETDFPLLRRVVRDSLPVPVVSITRALYANRQADQPPVHANRLAKDARIPGPWVENILWHYGRAGLVDYDNGRTAQYTEDFYDLLVAISFFA